MTTLSPFTRRAIAIIKQVPAGRVASYGQIAALAGNPRGARQIARILHTCSDKYDLPWHRIINSRGSISLPAGHGLELQKALLEEEGIVFRQSQISDQRFFWSREPIDDS